MNEASLSAYVLKRAQHFGAICVKVDASRRGWPDRIIVYKGSVAFIEVKNPNKKGRLSKIQEHMITQLRDIGGVKVYVVASKDEVDDALNDFFCM